MGNASSHHQNLSATTVVLQALQHNGSCEWECTSSSTITCSLLLHECSTFGPSLIKNNSLEYCIYFGGQQTFYKYKCYSYVRPLNTLSMVSLSSIFHWHGRAGISYPRSYHPAYPLPQEQHVNVCPPQYRTSTNLNSNT